MTTNTITADDTLTLYGRVFNDLAEGTVSSITFPNNLVDLKTGKNANTIFAKNATGNNGEMALRLVRGSSDDRFLQAQLASSEQDFASTVLCTGEFVKRLGDGMGNVNRDVYSLSGGVIMKNVEGSENVEGGIDQGVAVWNIKFAFVQRSIQ